MYSTILPDEIQTVAQSVYSIILAVFFVLAIVSWLVLSKAWFNEDAATPEKQKNHETIPHNEPEQAEANR